ncbi:MAG: nickel/cobalt transporter [Aquamicrobium sp.]|uniref:nickel/cobalt transporter n=1 Tax=Aquamicrobium sp. TaxID=1872579 RepID=UPI00349ED02D|nr:nickel/cobalt transporter [Aquamicrobium sp.]
MKVNKTAMRVVFATLALTYVLTHFLGHAHAQSSLGIGASEATLPSTGLFAGIFNWINAQQQSFYRALSGAMRGMRDGNGGAWLLAGLSFAYGVFHAAGPGHGKAVISSYMLANEVALRRGVLLSFVSAVLQAVSAIVLMGAVFLILRGSSVSMTDATRFLEIASYVLVTVFGAWLLWRKAAPTLRRLFIGAPAHSLSSAHAHDHHDHACGCDHHDHAHHHHHEHDESCGCGHSHAPDPKLISGERFDWRTAWAAVLAVGLRPCTGALIVLSFAFLNGLWVAGIASVFAMALGTAITVSTLAVLAVTAKNWAVALAGDGRAGNRVHAGIEIAGAAFVFLLGITLLSASLVA